jgi:hypothetical protein
MKTYFWDFFGPDAAERARHFNQHLDEFLIKNALAGCTTGVASDAAGQYAAWCRAPAELESAIERSLGPQRMVED